MKEPRFKPGDVARLLGQAERRRTWHDGEDDRRVVLEPDARPTIVRACDREDAHLADEPHYRSEHPGLGRPSLAMGSDIAEAPR